MTYRLIIGTLVLVWVVIQAFDLWSTNRFRKHGWREGNPVMRWMQDRLGPLWFIPKLTLGLGVAAYALLVPQPFGAIIIFPIFFYIQFMQTNWDILKENGWQ